MTRSDDICISLGFVFFPICQCSPSGQIIARIGVAYTRHPHCLNHRPYVSVSLDSRAISLAIGVRSTTCDCFLFLSLPLLHEPRPSQVKKQTQLIKRAVQVYTRCITNLEDERLNTSTTRQVGGRSLRHLLPPASYAARTRAQKALSARTRKPVRVSSAAVRRAAVCAASVRAPWANPGVWFFTSPGVGMAMDG